MSNEAIVNTLEYDRELCTGCRMCIIVCPHGVFTLSNHVAEIVQRESCMECGACQLNCPAGAIKVDSGVGCAAAMIQAALLGRKDVSCGGDKTPSCCGSQKRQI